VPFTYVMALRQSPTVGGNSLSDTAPEEKAAGLSAAADVHHEHVG
jgi:hypothetical protein